MLQKSLIIAMGFLVLFTLLVSATTASTTPATTGRSEVITLESEHSQAYFLGKNVAVDFSVECDGCDVLVSSQVDQVLAAEPYDYDRKLSSLKVAGTFARKNVKSNEDRVLVLRNSSPASMKIKYVVKASGSAHNNAKQEKRTLYVVGFVVGIVAVMALVLVLVSYKRNNRRSSSTTIIPETMGGPASSRINYGTYTPALSSLVVTTTAAAANATNAPVVSGHQSAAASSVATTELPSPVVPPVYFLYPVPPRYPVPTQYLNVAGENASDVTSALTMTTAAPHNSQIYPSLVAATPAVPSNNGRRANPI